MKKNTKVLVMILCIIILAVTIFIVVKGVTKSKTANQLSQENEIYNSESLVSYVAYTYVNTKNENQKITINSISNNVINFDIEAAGVRKI